MSRFLAALALGLLLAGSATAHEVRPAYLALRETTPDRFEVLFKVPTRGDRVLRLVVRFPVLRPKYIANNTMVKRKRIFLQRLSEGFVDARQVFCYLKCHCVI